MIRERVDASDCLLQGPVRNLGKAWKASPDDWVKFPVTRLSAVVPGIFCREPFQGLVPERMQYDAAITSDQRHHTPRGYTPSAFRSSAEPSRLYQVPRYLREQLATSSDNS
jgi:hypothetical protein